VEVSDMVEGLVDRLVQRFIKKHFAGRQPAPQILAPDVDRFDVTRISLPVFPPPPPLFPTFPFPVGGGNVLALGRVGGEDVLALRRAYAERCAYVDALVHRARTTAYQDEATTNYNNSISGCTTMTSPSTENVDHCSSKTHYLLSDHQLLQSRTQVLNISELISLSTLIHSIGYFDNLVF